MRSCCHSVCFQLLMDSKLPHVLAVRGIPLDGWYISVPGVSIGRQKYTSPQQSTNSYTKAVKSSGFQSTQTDEKITKVVVLVKPVTVRSLRAQKASSAEKPNVSLPKDQSLHKNEKSSKSEKWQQVKESKAAKRARVLAERRNQELTLPSNRPYRKRF
ncbi:hypothetical protein AVEN_247293-1 [Araneus ventricosus]|uniref:Uncharacterized protein n=1 Tax=Araneus ventricosus TaxID=182803 RepID=A0A4Y2B1W0_ARAVE|nr:hypothetical protein AVEN_247293-1 [Araneus ventricosus]